MLCQTPPPPPRHTSRPSAPLLPAVNKAQSVQAFAGKRPQLADSVFVAPNASVVGDVKIGSGASIWYGAVVRGEWRAASGWPWFVP